MVVHLISFRRLPIIDVDNSGKDTTRSAWRLGIVQNPHGYWALRNSGLLRLHKILFNSSAVLFTIGEISSRDHNEVTLVRRSDALVSSFFA
jgi:hypothetical protein